MDIQNKQRNYGVDFLRIIAMMMVLTLHVLSHGGIMDGAMTASNGHYYSLKLIQTLSFCAVNCYAIISGFVSVGKKVKASSLFNLIFTALAYTISISLVFYLFKRSEITLGSALKAMIPDYWYLTAYIGLFIFMPLLNLFLEKSTKKQMLTFLLVVFFFISCLQVIFVGIGRDPFRLSEGLSALWLMVCYLVGGYLKKYGINVASIKLKSIITFLVCILVTFLSKIVLNVLGLNSVKLLYHYTSPTMLIAATSLVVFFANLQFKTSIGKIVSYLSTFSFAVYLIHEQDFIYEYFMKGGFLWILNYNWIVSILLVILSCLIIYVICSVIDVIRFYLFKLLHINQLSKLIEKLFEKVKNFLLKNVRDEESNC